MDKRFEQLELWLNGSGSVAGLKKLSKHLQNKEFSLPVPASSDASFRRYFRIQQQSLPEGATQSFILMDAPPEHEDCLPFIQVSKELSHLGLQVPEILEQDLSQGFLLLTDLGTTTYLSRLQALKSQGGTGSEEGIDRLYREALRALVNLQSHNHRHDLSKRLPDYDVELLDREMNLFSDWLCRDYLCLPEMPGQQWQRMKSELIQSALRQPQTYVHRDYHSRNLMVTDKRNPGVLDFQDAVHGGLTYDAVSLLRDCYISWPAEQVQEWQRAYFLELCQQHILSEDEWNNFVEAMDLMGIQRHLKAAGIFARLYLRDGKEGYLPDIPQTLRYIINVGSHYPQLKDLTTWVENKVYPAFETRRQESV